MSQSNMLKTRADHPVDPPGGGDAPGKIRTRLLALSTKVGLPKGHEFLLVLFIAADVFFIALHIAYTLEFTRDPIFSLEGDRVAGEIFQYVKEYWIVFACAALYWRTKQRILGAWALVYAYLLADDSLQIHERIGLRLAEILNLPSFMGMRPRDFGEVLFASVCAAALLTGMALLFRKADANSRRLTRLLVLGLICLGVFGVGIDTLHMLTRMEVFTIVEDGGELLVMSCICWLMISEAWPERIQRTLMRAHGR